MREILFRGKRKDNGKWVYGSLLKQAGEYISKDEVAPIECWICGMRGEKALIVSETIGQYTGLKDVHGTRIFEGDVVTHKNYAFEVYYNNEYAGFYPFYDADNGAGYGVEAKNCEIIGNVFDNPELLEGDKT